VLKKAGIIVAAAATGVLALTSVAFADTSSDNVANDCAFGNAGGSPQAGAFGGSSLVGDLLGVVAGTATGAATQANTGNCTNLQLKDLSDTDSNNTNGSVVERHIEDSYNR
jgi:hypothetical protein